MLIRLTDPAYTEELADALRRGDCVPSPRGDDTLDVSQPCASSREQAQVELAFFLKAWTATHPGVEATLIA